MRSATRSMITFIATFLVFAAPSGFAQSPAATVTPSIGPVSLRNTYRHIVWSETMGEYFRVDVAMPDEFLNSIRGRAEENEKLPVIYTVDLPGLDLATYTALQMLRLGREIPPVILVSVGHHFDSGLEWQQHRGRDLTPTYIERADLPETLKRGGADKYLSFIKNEVKPMIRDAYPVRDDETLASFSLGGLFVLHVLFKHTEEFDRYLAGSPYLVWDDAVIFQEEASYAETHDDLDKKVFMSVGSLEEANFPEMVSNAEKMAQRLRDRNYPNLSLTHHVFDNETHTSVIPATFSRGLRELFSEDIEALREAAEASE